MLTSLPRKMNISLENALFPPAKDCFWMAGQPFFIYLSCTYICIPLFMRKIRFFVLEFPPAFANRWKYAILGTRKMQSVRGGLLVFISDYAKVKSKQAQVMSRRFSSGLLKYMHIPTKYLLSQYRTCEI